MNVIIVVPTSQPFAICPCTGYIIVALIALFLLGYLLYSLVKPEKL